MPDDTAMDETLTEREPHYEWLDPATLSVFRDGSGRTRLEIAGDRCYVDVHAALAFPRTAPDGYVGLLDGKDKAIGLIRDPGGLDEESQKVLRLEIERRYFVPTVTRVLEAKEEFGAIYFDVDTDHGRRQFVAKGLRDSMDHLGGGELMFSDVDGNRYHVRDWTALDPQSRGLLERMV
jgi:hypothetical protein